MTINTAVAQALVRDLDVLELLPELQSLSVEEVENRIDRFLDELQDGLCSAIEERGLPNLKAGDAAGLCGVLIAAQLRVPLPMLLRVCRTIIALWHGELATCPCCCQPVYFVRLAV